MDPVGAALTATKRHTETARGSLARIAPGAPAEEVASRLAVAAADREQLRRALNSTLDYQVLCPVALPSVPAHVAEFMRTRPEPAQEDAEAAALARDALLRVRHRSSGPSAHAAALHEHSAAVKRLAAAYDDAASRRVRDLMLLTAPGARRAPGGCPAAVGSDGGSIVSHTT